MEVASQDGVSSIHVVPRIPIVLFILRPKYSMNDAAQIWEAIPLR